MVRRILISIIIIFCLTNFVNASNIDGKWKGKFNSPNGEVELIFNFQTNGDTLTGTVNSAMGELPILNGKINGNEISFNIEPGGNTITHEGKISGDTIKLTTKEFPAEMDLIRIATSKIDGKWKGTVSSPNGKMELLFTFKVNGDSLSGADESAMGVLPLLNGKVNGNEFSYDVDVGGNLISHNCTLIDDNTINVKAMVMQNEIEMTLKRVEEK
jgi:hypothetical protein